MRSIQLLLLTLLLALPFDGYAQRSLKGDVNCDDEVNVADVNAVIDMILTGNSDRRGDVNGDGEVNIADVNVLIDIILNPHTDDSQDYVDLGLPSGTLWATKNVGADTPEGFGSFFSWGETTPKSLYEWSTYKWCVAGYELMSKYCTSAAHGTVDNKTELEYEDDAAYVNWGEEWCMPTLSQMNELQTKCSWRWTKMNGRNGYEVTGPNGNTLFLPAAGYRRGSSVSAVGSYGYYWSSSLVIGSSRHAYAMFLRSDVVDSKNNYRYIGHSVRPVRSPQYQQ